jgi:hypothetical protein
MTMSSQSGQIDNPDFLGALTPPGAGYEQRHDRRRRRRSRAHSRARRKKLLRVSFFVIVHVVFICALIYVWLKVASSVP